MKQYNRQLLEQRAADYYASTAQPKEKWSSYSDLQPKLNQFEHLISAGNYDAAARVVEEIDLDYLLRWGYTWQILKLRTDLSSKIQDEILKAQNLTGMAQALFFRGDFEAASTQYQQALDTARAAKDRETECRCLTGLGNLYRIFGDFAKAIERYQQALLIAVDIKNWRLEANNLAETATAYDMKGQSKEALEHYQQALDIFTRNNDHRRQGFALLSMGIIYQGLGQEEKAVDCYQKSMNIAEETNDIYLQQATWINWGDLYREEGRYDRALDTFNQAEEVADLTQDNYAQGYSMLSIGHTYLNKDNLNTALSYLQYAAKAGEESPIPALLNPVHYFMAQVYLMEKDNLNNASASIKQALEYAEEDEEEAHRTHVVHGMVLARLGSYEDARTAFKTSLELSQKLLHETPNLFAPKYSRGLALAGLAICAQHLISNDQKPENYIKDAIQAFNEAKANRNAPGVLADARQLLSTLQTLDSRGLLTTVLEVIKG